jgi:hypothetical protein
VKLLSALVEQPSPGAWGYNLRSPGVLLLTSLLLNAAHITCSFPAPVSVFPNPTGFSRCITRSCLTLSLRRSTTPDGVNYPPPYSTIKRSGGMRRGAHDGKTILATSTWGGGGMSCSGAGAALRAVGPAAHTASSGSARRSSRQTERRSEWPSGVSVACQEDRRSISCVAYGLLPSGLSITIILF